MIYHPPQLSGQGLGLTILELAGRDESLDLALPHCLDLVRELEPVKLASEGGNLVGVDLALDELDVSQYGVDGGGRGIAGHEVVGVLDGSLEHALVLLDGVLGGLLGLLGTLAVHLGLLLGLLGCLLLGLLLRLGVLGGLLLGGLLVEPLLVLGGVGLLPEALDALVAGRAVVEQLAEAGVVLGLLLLARVGVLALHVALLVAVLVVVGHVLVEVLEGAPAVKVVPEVVELLDLLLGGVLAAQVRDGVHLAEAGLGLEHLAPELVELGRLGDVLLAGGLDVGLLVDRVELAALDGVQENVGRLLDALEEIVVLGAAGGRLLIGVVLEHLLAMGALDLLLGRLEAVLGKTENLVVVLAL